MKFALLPEGKLQVGNQNISKRGEEVGAERRLHNEVSSDNVHAESRPCRPHSLTQVTGSGDLGVGWGASQVGLLSAGHGSRASRRGCTDS